MKNFSLKEIRFSGDLIKSCIVFIDLVDSTKNTITMDNLEHIRIYYSKFINSISEVVKSYGGKVIKNIGDCLLVYFPKSSNNKNEDAFREAIECGFRILDNRFSVNQELSKQYLPPFNYRISMDYGVLDLALVGDYSQIDLFGSTINICSKINSSSLASQNELIIGDNLYRILKSFSNIINKYNFVDNGECKINETFGYSTYSIKNVNKLSIDNSSTMISILRNNLLGSSHENFIETKSKKESSFHKKNNNNNKRRVILVDDEQDILFTFESFLKDNGYEIISFIDPSDALNYIKDLSNFDDILIILDIRMKNLNGFQLHQQIKAIDSTIKIMFVTALDILDELLSIIPGISKEQIMRKPVDKIEFTNTVKKLLK
ncbi:MAG TPA: response regulator [Nitrososphaeraceae archaeon]|nr:response regulator [Nitrososphaeraceae archaeon]